MAGQSATISLNLKVKGLNDLTKANSQIDELVKKSKSIGKGGANSNQFAGLNKELNQVSQNASRASQSTNRSMNSINTAKGRQQVKQLNDEITKLSASDKIAGLMDAWGKGSDSSLGKIGAGVTGVGKTLTKSLTVPIVAAGVAAAKTGMDFQGQMSRVGAIAGSSGKQLEKMKDQAIVFGAKTSFSAKEAAAGMENLASAGMNSKQIMQSIPGVLDLAAVSGGDVAGAAENAGAALNMFNLKMSQSGHVADVFALAAAKTNAESADMGEALKYVGPVAGTAGQSLESMAAAIGIMSNAGVKGSQAGTTLRGAMTRMAKPTKVAREAMKDLGISFYDSHGKMKKFKSIVGELKSSMSGLTDEQKQNKMATLFGQEALSGMMALVNEGPKKYAKLEKALVKSKGAAKSMASEIMNNGKGGLESLFGSLESFAINLERPFDKSIKNVAIKIGDLIDKFNDLPASTKKIVGIGTAIAAIAGPVAIGVGSLITFIAKVKSATGYLKGLKGAKLPTMSGGSGSQPFNGGFSGSRSATGTMTVTAGVVNVLGGSSGLGGNSGAGVGTSALDYSNLPPEFAGVSAKGAVTKNGFTSRVAQAGYSKFFGSTGKMARGLSHVPFLNRIPGLAAAKNARAVASGLNAAVPLTRTAMRASKGLSVGARALNGVKSVGSGIKGIGKAMGPLGIALSALDLGLAFTQKPGKARNKAVGGSLGSTIGGVAGAALGSLIPIPGVGTVVGGMAGSWLGGKAGSWIGSKFGGKSDKKPKVNSNKPKVMTVADAQAKAQASVDKQNAIKDISNGSGVNIKRAKKDYATLQTAYKSHSAKVQEAALKYQNAISEGDTKTAKKQMKHLKNYETANQKAQAKAAEAKKVADLKKVAQAAEAKQAKQVKQAKVQAKNTKAFNNNPAVANANASVASAKGGMKLFKDIGKGGHDFMTNGTKKVNEFGAGVKKTFGNVGGWMSKTWKGGTKAAGDMFDKGTKSVAKFGSGIGKSISGGMKAIGKSKVGQEVGKQFKSIGKTAGSQFKTIGKELGKTGAAWGKGFNAIGKSIGSAMKQVKTAMSNAMKPIIAEAKKTVKAIGNAFKDVGKRIGKAFNSAKALASKGLNAVVNVAKGVGKKVGAAFKTVGKAIGSAFKTVKSVVSKALKPIFTEARKIAKQVGNAFKGVGKAIGTAVKGGIKVAQTAFKGLTKIGSAAGKAVGKALSSGFKSAVNSVKNVVKGIGTAISGGLKAAGKVVTAILKALRGDFKGAFSDIKSAVSSSVKAIGSAVKAGMTAMTTPMNAAKAAAKTFGSALTGVFNAIKGAVGAMAGAVASAVSKVAGALGKIKLPHFANGTPGAISSFASGGTTDGGFAKVNDAPGATYREAFKLSNGATGIFPAIRNMVLPIPKGTHILDAQSTKRKYGRIRAFANGTTNAQREFDENKPKRRKRGRGGSGNTTITNKVTINLTVNNAKGMDEEKLSKKIAEKIQEVFDKHGDYEVVV